MVSIAHGSGSARVCFVPLQTIRELRSENEDYRKRVANEDSMTNESPMRDEYEKQLEQALTQNSDLERINGGKSCEYLHWSRVNYQTCR